MPLFSKRLPRLPRYFPVNRLFSIFFFFLFGVVGAEALTITPVAGQYRVDGKTHYSYVVLDAEPWPQEVLETWTTGTAPVTEWRKVWHGSTFKVSGTQLANGTRTLTAGASVVEYRSIGVQMLNNKGNWAHMEYANDTRSWGTVPFPPDEPGPPDFNVTVGLVPGQEWLPLENYQYAMTIQGSSYTYPSGRRVNWTVEVESPQGVVLWTSAGDVSGQKIPLPVGSIVYAYCSDTGVNDGIPSQHTVTTLTGPSKPKDPDPIDPLPDPEDPKDPDPEDPEDPDPENPDPENPGGGSGSGTGSGKDYTNQLNSIKKELEKQTEQDKAWYEKVLDFFNPLRKVNDEAAAQAEGMLDRRIDSARGMADELGARARNANLMGSKFEADGDGTFTLAGDSASAFAPWTIVLGDVTFDFNPLNTVKEWSWISWARNAVTLIISYFLSVSFFKAFKEAHSLLQVQAETHGNNELFLTILGMGVTSRTLAAFIKVGIYIVAAVAFSAVLWGIAASYGVSPVTARTLMPSGFPVFAYEFLSLFLPVEYFFAMLPVSLLMRAAVWLSTLAASYIRKGVSII